MVKFPHNIFSRRYLTWRGFGFLVLALLSFIGTEYFGQLAGASRKEKWVVDILGQIPVLAWMAAHYISVWWRLRNELKLLFRYHRAIDQHMDSAHTTGVFLAITRPPLRKEFDRLARVVVPPGLDMVKEELGDLTRSAFDRCPGPYYGTDSNVPSGFRSIYPLYLEDEIGRRRDETAEDIRFLIVDPATLQQDYERDPQEFLRFYDRHWQNHVQLLQVDPQVAAAACRKAALPSKELGVYEWRFVLFFSPDESGKFVRVLASELAGSLAQKCEMFFDELVDCAMLVNIRDKRRLTFTHPSNEHRNHLRDILVAQE